MPPPSAFTALCPGCFAEKGSASSCPHCGYDESLKRGPLVLAHRTLLHNGQYLIGKVLGKPGGFGITYLALDTRLETRVAIKEYLPRDLAGRDAGQATISAHSSEDGEFFRYGLTQFLQEARTLARFDHANIVRVRNFFEENGTGYLVMDYYDGVTLADHLAQQAQGKLPEKTAVGIMMPILDGLREVHAKNFLHRDIKPQNIYLTTGNRPILLDFGAARQAMSERSRSLSVVLSEGYAPYEQYHRRGEQGPWTDIYACAAVLYHAVSGEPPPPATERMSRDELDIGALRVSTSLTNALRAGLAVDHKKRPQTMAAFQGLLLGDGEPQVLTEVVGQRPEKAVLPPPLEMKVSPAEYVMELANGEMHSRPRGRPPARRFTRILKWDVVVVMIVLLLVAAIWRTESAGPYADSGGRIEAAGQKEAATAGAAAAAAAAAAATYKSSAAQEVPQALPPTPDPKDALKVLFGLSASGDSVRVNGTKSAQVWFSRLFQVGSEEFFVVFVNVFTLDKESKPEECHACSPSTGAVTYKLNEGKWTVVSKQLDIFAVGSWGKAGEIANAEIMTLAKGNIAFLFEWGNSGQGYYEGGTVIISYSQNKWQYLGSIHTLGDNAGNCDDSPSGRRDPDMQRCWKYSGKLSLEPDKRRALPNIIVNQKGTNFDYEKKLIAPAIDTRYVFDGKQYILEAEFNSKKK